jgi:hypothetical protein
MVLMMMAAAAFMVMVLVLMMVTAAALMVMVLVMMAAAAVFTVFMMVMMAAFPLGRCLVPGIDHRAALHRPGDAGQLFDQTVGIFCRQPKLFGGKGDGGLLNCRVIVELFLDFCSTVGTVQIVDDIYLSGHENASLFLYMSNYSCVYK